MRYEFTQRTRLILAGRVNYCCSFPGCANVTIGPSGISDEEIVILGEAAHIHAASSRGPRANPGLSPAALVSVKNGIWMCRNHARLIDVDHHAFSADTLKLWKQNAEQKALNATKQNSTGAHQFTSLVSISGNIVFEGVWVGINDNTWTFEIARFIIGDIRLLRESAATGFVPGSAANYIAVSSEGNARLLKSPVSWGYNSHTGVYSVAAVVLGKTPSIPFEDIGSDIALTDEGDISITGNDLTFVAAAAHARQAIQTILSSVTDSTGAPFPHSRVSAYYHQYHADAALLAQLIKLDLALHINIPFAGAAPSLPYISRIVSLHIPSTQLIDNHMPINLRLQWTNGEYWEDTINLYIETPL